MPPLTRASHKDEDPLAERNRAIIDLRNSGWSLQRLAKLFGIVPERVRQIESKGYSDG